MLTVLNVRGAVHVLMVEMLQTMIQLAATQIVRNEEKEYVLHSLHNTRVIVRIIKLVFRNYRGRRGL